MQHQRIYAGTPEAAPVATVAAFPSTGMTMEHQHVSGEYRQRSRGFSCVSSSDFVHDSMESPQPAAPGPTMQEPARDRRGVLGVRRPRSPHVNEKLRFYSAACCLPNPLKKNEGEDAYMISPCGSALAVADGVGGWAEIGVDSGKYSRELCRHAARVVKNRGELNPRGILRYAYDNSKSEGTSTCCILTINDNILRAANLGDSGFLVLRPSENGLRFIMQSEEQQYDFNTPRQLGTNSLDMPHDAHRYELQMHPGDIVIAGTDGLFDNLSVDDIMNELDRHINALKSKGCELSSDEETLTKLAAHMATTAYLVSKDPVVTTPFSLSAAKHNLVHQGGKMDDITIVVAIVASESAAAPPADTCPRAASPSRENSAASQIFFLPPAVFTMEDDSGANDENEAKQANQLDDANDTSSGNSPDTVYTNYSMDDHHQYLQNHMMDDSEEF